MELEANYNVTTRSAETVVSYTLAGGQPRTDEFYLNPDNREDLISREENNIFVPSSYNGNEINAISAEAFAGVAFNQLIIEYSSTPIKIGNSSFMYANRDLSIDISDEEATQSTITINRKVVFTDIESEPNNVSDNIFTEALVNAIVLPDTIKEIPTCTFYNCAQLENIYFRAPEEISDRSKMLEIINNAKNDNDEKIRQDESSYKIEDEIFYIKDVDHSSVVYLPNQLEFIGPDAFSSDINIKILIIENNVNEVCAKIVDGWNDNNQIVIWTVE